MVTLEHKDITKGLAMTNFTVNFITHQMTISVDELKRIFPNARINWSTY
jgi:hypothetical protein